MYNGTCYPYSLHRESLKVEQLKCHTRLLMFSRVLSAYLHALLPPAVFMRKTAKLSEKIRHIFMRHQRIESGLTGRFIITGLQCDSFLRDNLIVN